jgi:hypothetical protein
MGHMGHQLTQARRVTSSPQSARTIALEIKVTLATIAVGGVMERNQAREKRHSMSTPETLVQRRPCVQHNNRRPMGAERVVDTQHGTRLSPNQQETLSEGSRMQSPIRTDAQQRTRRSQSKAATRIESLSM